MYPLHLNYTTTLPCKTITMKITIFIIMLVLKSKEKKWKFDISDCHSLLTVQNPAKRFISRHIQSSGGILFWATLYIRPPKLLPRRFA